MNEVNARLLPREAQRALLLAADDYVKVRELRDAELAAQDTKTLAWCMKQARELVEALVGLAALRRNTESTYEEAYHAMFNSDGQEAWDKLYAALDSPLAKLVLAEEAKKEEKDA